MKKYWLNSLCRAGVALVVALGVVGCSKTNDTLGSDNFIPQGGDYKLYQDVIASGFNIKTLKIDSISTEDFLYPYLGSQITQREGLIEYSFVTQCYPYSTANLTDNDYPFGHLMQIDSAYFSLDVALSVGQLGRRYTVYVYELQKALPYNGDSTMYSNFDIKDYIGNEPLITIESRIGEQIYKKIPIDIVSRLMSFKKDEYNSVRTFHDLTKGYYIKTSLSQSGDVMSRILLDKSGFDIFYHNSNEKPETTSFSIYFNKLSAPDWYNQTYQINKSFNIISRDYGYKDPIFGVNYVNDVISTHTYVSGMAGLMTELEIPQSVIDELKAKVAAKGGTKVLVSNATLVIGLGDTTLDGYDGALKSLGAYKQYQPLISVSNSYLSDMAYVLEDYCAAYNTLTSFGGTLNRSTGEYRLNISSTIQGLINGLNKTNKIQIAASSSDKESTNVSVLENSETRPIRLEITYSVVVE